MLICYIHAFCIYTASSLKICNINLPKDEYNECIRSALELIITSPHNNRTSLKIPVFDPFTLNAFTLNLDFNLRDFRGGELKIKNLKNYGFSKLKVTKVRANFTDDSFDLLAKIVLPKIHCTALYKTSFTLAGVKADAKGQFNATVKEISLKALIKGKPQEINGERYMKIEKFRIDPYDVKDLKLSISGLFRDPQLSE